MVCETYFKNVKKFRSVLRSCAFNKDFFIKLLFFFILLGVVPKIREKS